MQRQRGVVLQTVMDKTGKKAFVSTVGAEQGQESSMNESVFGDHFYWTNIVSCTFPGSWWLHSNPTNPLQSGYHDEDRIYSYISIYINFLACVHMHALWPTLPSLHHLLQMEPCLYSMLGDFLINGLAHSQGSR